MAGLSTNAPGLWGGFAGLLYGSTALSTPPGFLADAPPAWVPAGGVLAFEFDNGLGYNSRNLATTTPDSILTYTNPSAKMVYGSDGVMGYAPHNFIRYSQEFDNATWTKNGVTVSANSVAAPDGTTTADTLTADAGTGTIPRVADVSTVTANGAVHTASIYAKAGTYSFVQIYLNNQGADWVNFTLSGSGTASANGSCTATITALSGGWYRLTMTYTAGSTDRRPFFMLAASGTATRAQSWNPAGTESIYIWGAQLNLGSSALTYIPTTTAAVYSLPIDHNPTTFEPLGVLIEEERKNLLQWSEQFDNAAWPKSDATVTGASINAIVAPDGTTTADKLVEAATTAAHAVYQLLTVTSGAHTFSIYLKAAERTWAYVRNPQAAAQGAWFDLSNGVVGTVEASITAAIQSVGNGWYRCSVTRTMIAGNDYPSVYTATADNVSSFAGDITKGIYIWGAQLEAGAFATSYIPTTNNVLGVTRLADQVSILTSAFGYSATAGTYTVEAEGNHTAGTFSSWVREENILIGNTPNQLRVFNGTTSGLLGTAGSYVLGTFAKVAAGYMAGASASAVSQDGAAVGTFTSPQLAVTNLSIGYGNAAIGQFRISGHIKRLTYFPTRKSNAELQVLTT
jgi:hypothetical protein